jgi:hypothetical protein
MHTKPRTPIIGQPKVRHTGFGAKRLLSTTGARITVRLGLAVPPYCMLRRRPVRGPGTPTFEHCFARPVSCCLFRPVRLVLLVSRSSSTELERLSVSARSPFSFHVCFTPAFTSALPLVYTCSIPGLHPIYIYFTALCPIIPCDTMSGLEALSIAANILQLVDITCKVSSRIIEFRNRSIQLPDDLRYFGKRLPAYVEILRDTKAAIDANKTSDSARKALVPLIQECYAQIKTLDTLLQKIMPGSTDNGVVRSWKAVTSLRYDKEIKNSAEVVDKCLHTLTQQGIAAARNLDVSGTHVPRMYTLFKFSYYIPILSL